MNITDKYTCYSSSAIILRNHYNKDEKLKYLFTKENLIFASEVDAKQHIKRLKPKFNLKTTILFLSDSSFRDLSVKQLETVKTEKEISKKTILASISKLEYEDLDNILSNWKIKCDVLFIHAKMNGTLTTPLHKKKVENYKKIFLCIPYGTDSLDDHSRRTLQKMSEDGFEIVDLRDMEMYGYTNNPTGQSKGKHLTKNIQKFTLSILLQKLLDLNFPFMVGKNIFY